MTSLLNNFLNNFFWKKWLLFSDSLENSMLEKCIKKLKIDMQFNRKDLLAIT